MTNFLSYTVSDSDIAIIGMACRFPGAATLSDFWRNLRDGVESITFFSDVELAAAGVDPWLLAAPQYVKANAVLTNIDRFDAGLFGFSPREAEVLDPQHRLFLECAWEALEHAGYHTEGYSGAIGVYAGVGMNTYLYNNLFAHRQALASLGSFQIMVSNDKDFLSTLISYKLNLTGPSVTVQTACSTSLVAVHLAMQSLLNGESDIALAGGVSVSVPQATGYMYQEGMIFSPDGHCRAFDARAQGTVGGSGTGIVVLKRLADALKDGDCVHAVLKGSAVNNDGALKVGFTAPSVQGQAAVILEAMEIAAVEAETISYIEAHGTGTPIGDPIEVEALTQAFRKSTVQNGFCAIGSVKTNFGHLDTAAGVAGLIKTVLALQHQALPPSLHFEHANPQIDFANSPFYVNTRLTPWQTNGAPRRAGVSSFGIGGTNAHVVVEEAPNPPPSDAARPWQLLALSAATRPALDAVSANLVAHLTTHPELNFADVAYTLSVGRRGLSHRRMVVCRDSQEAISALSALDPQRVFTGQRSHGTCSVAFLFPGQGSQYVNMAAELYQGVPVFRAEVDSAAELLTSYLRLDIREAMYPRSPTGERAVEQLQQTALVQPALFVIEYALARLWMEWGVYPQAMLGHSIGEYVAACLAGVFSLPDALAIVAARGQLMQRLPTGRMVAVALPAHELEPLLGDELALAAVNGPSLSVVSGASQPMAQLQQHLVQRGITCQVLHTSHAFHSSMMDPILPSFVQRLKAVTLNPPRIPFVSNVTGTWITEAEATSPAYWANQLRSTVRFADGVRELFQEPQRVLLEVGPGRTLSTLATSHPTKNTQHVVISSMRHLHDQQSDTTVLLTALGRLWLTGVGIDWARVYQHQQRSRLPLPTYPFARERYWLEPAPHHSETSSSSVTRSSLRGEEKHSDIANWLYVPLWRRAQLSQHSEHEPQSQTSWLVFVDGSDLSSQLVTKLRREGYIVMTVEVGTTFVQLGEHAFALNPRSSADYASLLRHLRDFADFPQRIFHLWGIPPRTQRQSTKAAFEEAQYYGFYSLLFLLQAIDAQSLADALEISIVSTEVHDVTGDEDLCPEKAPVLALVNGIPQEYPYIRCRNIDVPMSALTQERIPFMVEQLLAEALTPIDDSLVAYRGRHRWVRSFLPWVYQQQSKPGLRHGGTYLITGGLGMIGLSLAEHLARTVQAKLILVGRSVLPPHHQWRQWIQSHAEDDEVSYKLHRLLRLETLASQVLPISADVADQQQMERAIASAEQRLGQIHGVIHAAGIIGNTTTRSIYETDVAGCEQLFHAKVHGLLTLDRVLRGRPLDFAILFSSLSSVLGGLGLSAYAAANIFMDAFAQQRDRRDTVPWVAINWDGWQPSVQTEEPSTPVMSLDSLAITPAEGVTVFERLLAAPLPPQVVVSTADLQRRIQHWIHTVSTGNRAYAQRETSTPTHTRPELPNPYVAPRTEREQKAAELWQSLLGIQPIGVYDNFFDLGGHSLLVVQLLAAVRDTFQVNLHVRTFFDAPTIASLAETIEHQQLEQHTDLEKVGDLIQLVENLPEEQLESLLAGEEENLIIERKGSFTI